MGFLGELKESLLNHAQAARLSKAQFFASGNPFVEVDNVPMIGELTDVHIMEGYAKVIMPMKNPVEYPARNVHLLNETAVVSE